MASISTPSSLATFEYAHASSSRVPHVTLGPVYGSKGKLAVAAVHGDGVWTYDIKTLRPTTSFTVPPSTVFSGAPVSFIPEAETEESDSRTRVTAVAVQAGEGVKDGRTIWVWKGEDGEKKSVQLETPAHSVHCVRGGWPLIVVGANGGLVAVNSELEPKTLLKPKPKAARILAARVIDGLAPRAVLIDERGRAHIYSLEVNDSRADLVADGSVSSTPLLTADVGADGLLTAVDNANRVHSRTVKSIVEATPSTGSVHLAHPTTPAAIVSLPSSSRPLAALAVPHPSPSVALVVPSPELPAVLASTPISTAATNSITHLAVIARPSDDSVVVGTVLSHPGADGSGRSVIHVVDMALPVGGVGLALLVGSSERTASVFAKVGGASAPLPAADRMIESVCATLRSGTVDAVARAEKAFTSWVEDEDKSMQSIGRHATIPEPIARKAIDAVFSTALKDGKKTGPYAAKIIQTLVDRKAVADGMWLEGVLLGALVPAADWRNVSRFVRTNPSLPSRSSVGLIVHALKEGTPTLASVLQDILSGPSPDPAYRVELRRQVDGPGAVRILEQLVSWAEESTEAGDGLDVWPERAPKSSIPTLASIVAHSSFLLDAHLPTLLAIPEAEPLIVRMQEALAPALAAQQDYRRLAAPVDAALRLAKTEKKEVTTILVHGKKPIVRVQNKTPGFTEEAVGKYRIEDLTF